jgi:uncharacterized protein YndB with AHSA1/START domain
MRSLALVPIALVLAAGAADAVPPAPVKKAVIVAATPADAWAAWATTDGVKTFLAPAARVEAVAGGPYEVLFDPDAPAGARGCEGCTVVSAEPPRKLVFTWSFPPSIPELRSKGTMARVTVELLPGSVEGSTLVALLHDGFPEGEAGEKGRAYFDKAWDGVLARLQQRFRHGPVDWSRK